MALIHFALALLATFAASNAFDVLDNCDDCRSSVTPLTYGPITFGGVSYGAFAVYSNGYLVLVDSPSSVPQGYSFNPTPISQTHGSPLVAGYWADANLNCPGLANSVAFEESCEAGLLQAIRAQISGIDDTFVPTSAIVARYNAVQRFNCPSSGEDNTFTITLATSSITLRSYVIFDYDGMAWDRGAASPNNPPTVGYSNGNCLGFQVDLGSDPVSTLNRCRRITLRVDQPFGAPLVQMNRGNVALAQQDPKLAAAMYGPFGSKESAQAMYGTGGAKAMYGTGGAKAMYGFPRTAIEQSFPEKNTNAMSMEDKLTNALQSAAKN